MPGRKPHIHFPAKPTLDGTEELYTQTGGVNNKFTVQQIANFITTGTAASPFVLLDEFADLPDAGSVDETKIYVVKDYDGAGNSESVVWDSVAMDYQIMDEEENPFVVAADVASLPATGEVNKLYFILDDGNGNPQALRWDDDTNDYVDVDTDTGDGSAYADYVTTGSSANLVYTASGNGVTYSRTGNVGTITIPAGVDMRYFALHEATANLGGSSDFVLRIVKTDSGVINQGSIASYKRPMTIIENRDNLSNDPPTSSFPYKTALAGTPPYVQQEVITYGSNSVDIKFNNVNVFALWSIFGTL